ncbi:MAG: hypothetical protein KA210_03260 [Bacteroidia bacterium]|nr:hypothetical protein [Bacteroidia bacterium]
MKKKLLSNLMLLVSIISYGQIKENLKLIELGKAYKNFMFRNEAPKEFINNLKSEVPTDLQKTTDFIIQTLTSENELLNKNYLTLPDNLTLKNILIVIEINHNVRKENQKDNQKIIDSIHNNDISRNELIDNYYSTLFAGVGNKNKSNDYSKIDFKLDEYNLENDTEKGIFYLQSMDFYGTTIWGYINIVKPPNTEKAFSYIKKFPKYNGLKYYQYTDLNFQDFELKIIEDNGKESYKSYYINKLYNLLLSHLLCLKKENAKDTVMNDLLLGSILKDRNLYKYSKNKDILESIFTEVKRD